MTRDEWKRISALRSVETRRLSDIMRPGKDRTLVLAKDISVGTNIYFHTYVKRGRFWSIAYDRKRVMLSSWENPSLAIVAGSRSFLPEYCDAKFCELLTSVGVPFKNSPYFEVGLTANMAYTREDMAVVSDSLVSA